jgi:hypothetical protein
MLMLRKNLNEEASDTIAADPKRERERETEEQLSTVVNSVL